MKRFVRKDSKDFPYISRPKLSEVVKAVEDAWSSSPEAVIGVDKGSIKVTCNGVEKGAKDSFTYDASPRLYFECGTYVWTVSTHGAGFLSRVRIGEPKPYPLATCSVPFMGDFQGRADDIRELEAAVEELKQMHDRVKTLLESEEREPE